MKTVQDYINDPDLADEPEALREVHAIRIKIHEERKDLTPVEYNALVHERAQAFLAKNKVLA
jgi:hypothetical protein